METVEGREKAPRARGWRGWPCGVRFSVMAFGLLFSVWCSGGTMALSYILSGRRLFQTVTLHTLEGRGDPVAGFFAAMDWVPAAISAGILLLCIWEGCILIRERAPVAVSLGRVLILSAVVVMVAGVAATPSYLQLDHWRFRAIDRGEAERLAALSRGEGEIGRFEQ